MTLGEWGFLSKHNQSVYSKDNKSVLLSGKSRHFLVILYIKTDRFFFSALKLNLILKRLPDMNPHNVARLGTQFKMFLKKLFLLYVTLNILSGVTYFSLSS